MKVLIISESFIVRDSLSNLFKEIFDNVYIESASNKNEFETKDLSNFNFIFIDATIRDTEIVNIVENIRRISQDAKMMVMDVRKNKNLFLELVKLGVDGYILNILDKEEFIYIVKRIMMGKKFYDSELLQESIENQVDTTNVKLTQREFSVLTYVCKGFSNKEIAKALAVTDYTIKKHVSSILHKLHLKNRQDIIIYARDNNLVQSN
ncbi:response regulator transcription factor [Romboutsia lituseburensis]|uniref:Stage 0 sporulation protein A homolog n=1 Tax=Romboutsia lituseburensis DSM 797 TaxID=1121325 RepID=A0A1G9JFW0_9FIRM|nr:response regulator transcription factor [Romboutsia lituseburensis]CEH33508.1 helix_turn_helix, Lux Regulon [Romboutsia lituseburensis]SDL36348.1 DNA-binding response regulator, NarL/FixJ family, contains REC and HTH domains [Romboutsia lituseburensis DSM 797]